MGTGPWETDISLLTCFLSLGWVWRVRVEGQTATLVSVGSGWGLLHLQQSLNKLGVGSGAEERVVREEGAASVQLVGRTQVRRPGAPRFLGNE